MSVMPFALLLDKSALQGLSVPETKTLALVRACMVSVPPVLFAEILADLAKTNTKQPPQQVVAGLCSKLAACGDVFQEDYRTISLAILSGATIEMDGRPVPAGMTPFRESDGSSALFFDSTPYQETLYRWRAGDYELGERLASGAWRKSLDGLSLDSFRAGMTAHHIVVPTASSPQEIPDIVGTLLLRASLQETWLRWIAGRVGCRAHQVDAIVSAWQVAGRPLLKYAFPFIYHCLRVQLALFIGVRDHFIKWKGSNVVDAVYLYYLPFCHGFVSSDHLHVVLAPLLMEPHQRFATGADLKEDLRRIQAFRDHLKTQPDLEHAVRWALGEWPPPYRASLLYQLAASLNGGWTPPQKKSDDMSEEAQRMAIEHIRQLDQELSRGAEVE
jgi:hypothetical protein